MSEMPEVVAAGADLPTVSVEELAELLHVGKSAVYRWCSERRIEYTRLGKKNWFRISAVNAFVQAQTRRAVE